jgi:hypothetical protein
MVVAKMVTRINRNWISGCSRNEKACAGGVRRLFEMIGHRLGGGVPLSLQATLGRRSGPPETRSAAGGGALLRWICLYTIHPIELEALPQPSHALSARRQLISPKLGPSDAKPIEGSQELCRRVSLGVAIDFRAEIMKLAGEIGFIHFDPP